MQSSGGLAAPETVRKYPIRLLESGPAGGALVASFLGEATGESDVLSFDMGGTTAKACLVQNGRPDLSAEMEAARVHRFKKGSGLAIKSPVVDLMEIGAGGGSIARADQLGLLRVGPQSAGANPGPACYGQGGTESTVTDACLALGYFDPEYFLGGAMKLDAPATERALEELGNSLDISATDAAWGIYSVVCENMASAARVHIIEKGQDPRRYPMIAFGGAGPATATRVARALGLPEVIIPPVSGVASAMGFLVTPVSFEFSRSYPDELRSLAWDQVWGVYREMEEQAYGILGASGVEAREVRLERWAEMRLSGQFHDIEVPVPGGRLD
ncbi:MAG: hydantoinase/oxoprolinase family protein, partial [Rubrobacteraceae bacterium]